MSPDHRILIVNDDPTITKQITDLLDSRNRKYEVANTGKTALTIADRYDFSLAFIDLDLPDMSAADFYAELLKKESHYTLPVVSFIDTFDPAEIATLNKIVSLGQISLLSKPAKQEWLTALLDKHLS